MENFFFQRLKILFYNSPYYRRINSIIGMYQPVAKSYDLSCIFYTVVRIKKVVLINGFSNNSKLTFNSALSF